MGVCHGSMIRGCFVKPKAHANRSVSLQNGFGHGENFFHCTLLFRGNNRDPIFIADEGYRFYLEKLKAACDRHACDVHAYVLVTNHVHLLITPHRENSCST